MNEQQLFVELNQIADAHARRARLDQLGRDDPALAHRLEARLAAHRKSGTVPNLPGDDQRASLAANDSPTDRTTDVKPEIDSTDEEVIRLLAPPTEASSLGRLAHYEVRNVLGRGGFGVVLQALDTKLQRIVAIKMMSPTLAATSPPRKRFLREARAAAAIKHENVVAVYDVQEGPVPYLIMEYVGGESLQHAIDRTGPLDVAETVRIARQIAEGLSAAHDQGLIHRDVKPGNILLEAGPHPKVKLTDFGLARTADDASLTQSGMIAGTPLFMSPEQARGQHLDHRSDLFSLGSVLYTMCCGRPPFRAPTTLAVIKRVSDDVPRPIREVVPDIPEWLCRVVERLLEKSPERRFQTASEVIAALEMGDGAASRPQSDAPTGGSRSARLSHKQMVLSFVVALGLIAFAFGAWRGATRDDRQLKDDSISDAGANSLSATPEQNGSPATPSPKVPERRGPLAHLRRDKLSVQALELAGRGNAADAPRRLVGVLGSPEPIHVEPIMGAAFSPDGKWFASCSGKQVLIVAADTGTLHRAIRSHDGPVRGVAFSSDSRWLATGAEDGTVRIEPVVVGTGETQVLRPDIKRITCVATDRDGKYLVVGGSDGQIARWEWNRWDDVRKTQAEDGEVSAIDFNKSAELVAVGFDRQSPPHVTGDRLMVFQTRDLTRYKSLPANELGVFGLSFHPERDVVAVAGRGPKPIMFWDINTGMLVEEKVGWTYHYSVAYHPDGKGLVCGQQAGFEYLKLDNLTKVHHGWFPPTRPETGVISGVRFNRDGSRVALWAALGGQYEVRDTSNWKSLHRRSGHAHVVCGLSVSRDGTRLLTAGDDKTVRYWNVATGEHKVLDDVDDAVNFVRLSGDGKMAVSSHHWAWYELSRRGVIWNAEAGREIGRIEKPIFLYSMDLARNGNRLVGGTGEGLFVWEIGSRQRTVSHPLSEIVHDIAIDAAGKRVVSISHPGNCRVWSVDDNKILFEWNTPHMWATAIDPTGQTIAVGYRDGSIQVRDAVTGGVLQLLTGHTKGISKLLFSPDGKKLYSGGFDGTIRIWSRDSIVEQEVIRLGPENHPLYFDVDGDGEYLFVNGHAPVVFILRLTDD